MYMYMSMYIYSSICVPPKVERPIHLSISIYPIDLYLYLSLAQAAAG